METNSAKSVATRNDLAVKFDRSTGIIESIHTELPFLLTSLQTAQSLHPGGRYYPGQTHTGDSGSPDNSSKEFTHPADTV